MSIEKPLREMVQAELKGRLGPMHKAITRMGERLDVIDELSDIIKRLAPLATRMQSLQLSLPGLSVPVVGRGRSAAPAPAARGQSAAPAPAARGRQAAVAVVPVPRGRPGRPPAALAEGERRCAVIGCTRPARSKGYCSAHYQKLRLLVKTGRRPAAWVDDAKPQSVAEIVLPRGRAASKAREEVAPQRPEPTVPPKPKAWVRKKGGKERISLH
ncbi:hypothetical protein [Vitiosangium sp. GDMCC 1.1324]|uniref:hypothetical protein n=1 Tax=Vitiosangium sp. (strain GDMCC 1.1324) TaxID=2138576 RepID=UPI000D3C1EEA|nr:hypothetical protein [Vitiosangium sp. GDMCC 1.1324]PTL79507.1 hypothetical protein DAT35_32340 [Vitiosangium sp. GDMCC 1.1324]